MSAARSGEDLPEGVFHLISAHEVAPRWRLNPTYVALCGASVVSAGMPEDSECPNECECELTGSITYCPACLRAALGQNHRAGVEPGSSMVTAHGR